MGIVKRDSAAITIIAYLGAAIGFINKLFLFTNFLSTEQVGLANLLITLAALFAQFASLGSLNIVYKYFPFFSNKPKHHHGFLFGLSALAFAGFIMTTLIFLVFYKPFTTYYSNSSSLLVEYSLYLIPLGLATIYYNIFESYLRSLHKNIIPSLTSEILLRVFITLSVSAFALGWIDFQTFVAVYVVANCLPTVVVVIYTAYLKQLLLKPIYSKHLMRMGKMMLLYGLFSMMNNLSSLLTTSIDSLMVAHMIDLGTAGIYTTMIFMTSTLLIPYRAIVKVATPLVSEFWKERAMNKMNELYRSVSSSSLIIGAGIFLILWINIENIFQFMPGDYKIGKYVFLVLGVGRLFDMAAGLNGVILTTSKKYRFDLIFTIGLVLTTILTNIVFIRLFGMNGAALATTITLVIYNLLRILFLHYHFKIQPFFWKQLWVPVVLFAIIIAESFIGHFQNVFLDIIIRSIVVGTLFAGIMLGLKISTDVNKMVIGYYTRFNIWLETRITRLNKQ